MSRDHPRECGKNLNKSLNLATSAGSPPRVREKPNGEYPNNNTYGITPASAGKTLVRLRRVVWTADHPRECGKNCLAKVPFYHLQVSPPRVREKLNHSCLTSLDHRITPASAGKTIVLSCMLKHLKDHPRECGKNFINFSTCYGDLGSPPRVREKPLFLSSVSSTYRITSASAGKTNLSELALEGLRDHPRECGKN